MSHCPAGSFGVIAPWYFLPDSLCGSLSINQVAARGGLLYYARHGLVSSGETGQGYGHKEESPSQDSSDMVRTELWKAGGVSPLIFTDIPFP